LSNSLESRLPCQQLIIICGTKEGISAIEQLETLLWAMDCTYMVMNFTNREDSVKDIYARKILAINKICLFCFVLPSRGRDGQKLPMEKWPAVRHHVQTSASRSKSWMPR